MIADDEQIVLDGIQFMIEDTFTDIEIVAMVHSGREAIEACQAIVPDIIFMDIKMPGINGIEAIETIKKRYQDTKFIIISAYEQFEYAKQAVELGVSDYILKPIHPRQLADVLRKVTDEIKKERAQKFNEIRNKEKLQKIIPILEQGFIYSLLLNTDYGEELQNYQELFEIKKEYGYIMVLEFGEGEDYKKIRNKIGMGVKGYTFYPKVQNVIKYKCKCIIGPMIINRMTVLIYEDTYEKEYEQRLRAMTLAEHIYEKTFEFMDSSIYIGIGSCCPLNKIKNSMEEALHALNRITSEKILHINDISELKVKESDYTYIDIKEDQTRIIQLIETADEESLKQALNVFFHKLEKKIGLTIMDMNNIITELMVMVLSCSYRNKLDEEEAGYSTYFSELKRLDSLVEIQNWCIRKIVYIAQIVQSKKHQHVSKVVLQAKNYIDKHYKQEMSLIDISKEVSISPQYFSKIFKEEIGLSFVEYVRKIRMDIAKEMLRTKRYSVKEICYEIGYHDPNYFSRLFKKLVGVSPTDFK